MKIDQRDADAALGGEVHSHSSWMLPAVLLVVAAAIAAGVFIYLTGPTVEELQGNTPSPTAATETADIRIDGVLFRVPASFTRFRRGRSSGDQDSVEMHALLPNLAPWSPRDAAAFEDTSPNSRALHFTLAIDRAPLPYQEKFERGIRPRADNPDGQLGPFGLTTYKFSPGTGYENTDFFSAQLADGSQYVVRCDASANPAFGTSCMRVLRLPDNVGLTYKFRRAHLAQWKEIDAGVLGLIQSFRRK